jgi:four helix bundle protein
LKNNEVREKSFAFAKRIVLAYQYLCDEKKEYVLSKQLLRSGTSIGANIAVTSPAKHTIHFSETVKNFGNS